MDVSNNIIIITGASEGIGLAAATKLSAAGAKLVLAARNADKLTTIASQLPGSVSVPTDMTQDADVTRLVEQAVNHFGRVDVLINNAGRGLWSPVATTSIEEYRDLMELNVYGYLRAMQAVIPIMRQQGGGMIVNVSSMVTAHDIANLGVYSATKHSVNVLSRIARQELVADHILVKLLMPKLVLTDFGKHAAKPEPDALRDQNNPQRPPADTPETVAEKLLELIMSDADELQL